MHCSGSMEARWDENEKIRLPFGQAVTPEAQRSQELARN